MKISAHDLLLIKGYIPNPIEFSIESKKNFSLAPTNRL